MIIGSLMLIPDIILFATVACYCLVELVKAQRQFKKDPDASTSSTGTEMRRRLQLLLLIANTSRCLSLVAEAVLYESYLCPSERTCAMVRCIPDVFFLSMYSLLILFWAQLAHTATGGPVPLLRPVFVVGNASLYLGFLLVIVLSATVLTKLQVHQGLFYLLGIFYLLNLLFLLKYGVRMIGFTNFSMPVFVRRRIMAMCGLCSVVFVIHSVYFLGIATGSIKWKDGYPPNVHVFAFDASFYTLFELVPSLAILAMMSRRKTGPAHTYLDINNNPYTPIREIHVQGYSQYIMSGGPRLHGEQFRKSGSSQVTREGSNGIGILGLYSPLDQTPAPAFQAT